MEQRQGPTGCSRIVQIHPTRRCNLRCLHCYSSSGPEERDELDLSLLLAAVDDAAAAGYSVVGVSGGEPLMYQPLKELLAHARTRGMRTTVTTNGMLLDDRRVDAIRDVTCVLAISLDGVPASHNMMRAHPRAFDVMAGNLERVRRAGIPFGFVFTLTQHNLHEVTWVLQFALEQGARLLQIHPLEECGRAELLLKGRSPDAVESSFAVVAAARLQEMAGDRLYVQLDLANRDYLAEHPERVFAGARDDHHGPSDTACAANADLVSPLVIEPDGTVVPLQYGFPRGFALGNVIQAPLCELLARWRVDGWHRFLRLCRQVYGDLTAPTDLPIVDWYEKAARKARQSEAAMA